VQKVPLPGFSRNLTGELESALIWELKTDGHVKTLNKLIEQSWWARHHYGTGTSSDLHVTFLHNPKYADAITDFFAHVHEYTYLLYTGTRPKHLHYPYLGPMHKAVLDNIRSRLKSAVPEFPFNTGTPLDDIKYGTVGLRAGIYDDANRIGFEARSLGHDPEAGRHVLTMIVKFLQDPTSTKFRFGANAKFYTLDMVSDVERLSVDTVRRYSQSVRELMGRVNGHAAQYPEASAGLMLRWAVPMVKWELRPNLPAEVKALIVSERELVVTNLERLAAKYQGAQTIQTGQVQRQIDGIVHHWIQQTKLWKYL